MLTMVCVVQNSQDFSGLFPSSGIPKTMTFRKLDLFPSSGEGGGEDTYSVGPLRAPVSETWFLEYRTMEKVQKNYVNSQYSYIFICLSKMVL
jgi:hypothetical protein